MSSITYDVSQDFPFDKLSLANPHGIQGGAYFSKIRMKDDEPFLFQTPKCSTKNGIVTTDKKIYCDLMLSDHNEKFINFLQELEKSIQHLIFEKRNLWFHNNMEMENIEYFFNPLIRTYKKKFLVRTYIQQPKHIKNIKSLQIYDENENRLSIKDVTKEKKVIAILEGLGIKFTSSSFHLELCLRQAMVLEDKPIFRKCLIQMQRSRHMESLENDHNSDNNNNKIMLSPTPKIDAVNTDISENNPSSVPQFVDMIIPCNGIEAVKIDTATTDTQQKIIKEEEIIKTEVDISNNKIDDDKILSMDEEDSEPEEFIESEDELVVINNKNSKMIKDKVDIDTPANNHKNKESLEQTNELSEITVEIPNKDDCVHLKPPIEVYREIYRKAREKAKAARRLAIQAFLEAKQIKNTFLAEEVEESDDDLDTFDETTIM